jgi:hypothetical protein
VQQCPGGNFSMAVIDHDISTVGTADMFEKAARY